MEREEIQNRLANVDANFAITHKDLAEAFERIGARTNDALILARQSTLDAKEAMESLTAAINTYNTLGFPINNC